MIPPSPMASFAPAGPGAMPPAMPPGMPPPQAPGMMPPGMMGAPPASGLPPQMMQMLQALFAAMKRQNVPPILSYNYPRETVTMSPKKSNVFNRTVSEGRTGYDPVTPPRNEGKGARGDPYMPLQYFT